MPGNLPHEVSAAYRAGLSAGARAAEPRDGFDVATPGSVRGHHERRRAADQAAEKRRSWVLRARGRREGEGEAKGCQGSHGASFRPWSVTAAAKMMPRNALWSCVRAVSLLES